MLLFLGLSNVILNKMLRLQYPVAHRNLEGKREITILPWLWFSPQQGRRGRVATLPRESAPFNLEDFFEITIGRGADLCPSFNLMRI